MTGGVSHRRVARAGRMGAAMAMIGATLAVGAAASVPGPAVSAAGVTMECAAGYVYSVTGDGQLRQIDADGTVTDVGAAADDVGSFNGLGIDTDGVVAYGYERTNNSRTATIHSFSPATGTWTNTGVVYDTSTDDHGGLNGALVTGAVDLRTHGYLFGGYASNGTSLKLWEYDPATTQVTYLGWLDTSSGAGRTNNGDMAFNANGDLFAVRGSGSTTTVFSVTAANLDAARGNPGWEITAAQSASFTTISNVNGVAFDAAGKAYLGNGSSVSAFTMPTWSDATPVASVASGTDLASCSSPATLTLQKVVNGRVHDTDQFTLSLRQDATELGSATTVGTADGLQPQTVGPLPVTPTTTVEFTESGTGETDLGDYTTTYACTVDDEPFSDGTGTSGSITIPATAADVVCTFVNTMNFQPLTVAKTAAGTYSRTYPWTIAKAVDQTSVTTGPGGTAAFAYTVTVTPGDPIDSAWALDGTVTVTNPNVIDVPITLSDTPVDVGGDATCTFTDGETQTVPAGSSGTYPYTCTFATQPTYTGGTNTATATWTVEGGGSATSDAAPVTFSLGEEIGKTVTVTDDQTTGTPEVLGEVTWTEDATPTTFEYTLELPAGAVGECSAYTNTAAIAETGQRASQDVAVCVPAWSATKTADPATGSTVDPGGVITYTLTASNDGEVPATGIVLTDDLTEVLTHATFGSVADGHDGSVEQTGDTLTWTLGELAPGTTASLSYTVTVATDAYGVTLRNAVVGTGDVPPSSCTTDEPCVTEHDTPEVVVEPPTTTTPPTSPTTVPPATPPSVAPPATLDPGTLPRTGSNTTGLLGAGAILLLVGGALTLVVARRRHADG